VRTPDSVFIQEKNKQENAPIRLYEIEDYDGAGNNLYLAENDEDVSFGTLYYLADTDGNRITDTDGNYIIVNYTPQTTYTRFPIICEKINENTQGEIDYVRVTLANVSQVIQSYLKSYDFREKKVTITTIWRNHLDNEDISISDIYYIDSYVSDIKNVTFTLTSKFDLLDVEIPFRKYGRTYCSWKFKSTECGYSGGESSCNRSLQRCRELSNVLRFGGYPSVPARRLFIQ
jgi:phage-related protein